eukprot:107025-Hanusia_phi.AAC.1
MATSAQRAKAGNVDHATPLAHGLDMVGLFAPAASEAGHKRRPSAHLACQKSPSVGLVRIVSDRPLMGIPLSIRAESLSGP